MLRLPLLAAAIAAAIVGNARADEVTDLDDIVVSASTTRMPSSNAALPNTITVITREDLDRQLAVTQDLSQVLANLVPAFAPSRQKLTSFGESLRGRQPLYMIDGVPQSTPLRDGSRDAHTIDPAMIERIEILHGANALHGLGASGGLINIITKRAPKADGFYQEVALGGSMAMPRQKDDAGWRGSWLTGMRSGNFDFVGGASISSEGLYYDGEGRAIGVDTTQGELMDSESYDLFTKAGWNLSEAARLQLTANRYRLDGHGDYVLVPGNVATGTTASSVRGTPEGDAPSNEVDSLALDFSHREFLGGQLQAQLFWMDFEALFGGGRFGTFQDEDGNLIFDQSQNASEKTGAKLGWTRRELFGLPLTATFGLDVLRDETEQSLAQTGRLWVPNTVYRSVSPFVQAEWWFDSKVMLTGGLRHERSELDVADYTTLPFYGSRDVEGGTVDMRETLPNFGAVWYLTGALNVYASYAEGYTVADVGRVLRAVNIDGERVEDLVDLSPVITDNREIGLDYDNGRWIGHLAYYQSESELGSLLVYDAANNVYNVQRQPTDIEGIEATLSVRIGESSRIGGAYAYTRGEYDRDLDGDTDTDLEGINISPDRLTAHWEQDWTNAFSMRLQASHSFERDFDRAGTQVATFDGYTTLDLHARLATAAGNFSIGIENLLDRHYISYFSQTTPANDTYNAGRGRVLSLSWSRRF
jgi:iron complex outermembrane receptor protein